MILRGDPGLGPCLLCTAPASAALVISGVTAYGCREHIARVDSAMIELARACRPIYNA